MNRRAVAAFTIFLLAALSMLGGFPWFVNRVYVHEGQSLLLRYKGPLVFGSRDNAAPGQFAEEGQIGVLRDLRGPGRHFYCPIWWERKLVDDMIIRSGELGIVRSKMGTALSRRNDWVRANPSSPGIMISTTRRSKVKERNFARALSASLPVVTRNPCSVR